MKKLILTAAALMIAVAAHAQGAFTFNTRNLTGDPAKNIRFTDASGNFLSGADFFVQVFAGPAAGGVAGLQPLDGALPLNRTGNGAGYTNPFLQAYTTSFTGDALIGYAAYQGSSWANATLKSPIISTQNGGAAGAANLTVALQAAPNLPLEVALGTGTVALVPEPTTLALGLLGLGALLAFRRRQ
jgi:hypothetical protein